MRQALVALLGILLLACGGGAGASSGGSGGGSLFGGGSSSAGGTSGMTHCPQSGDVTKISDKDTQGEFQFQQKNGATGGDIEVYADSAANCMGMPDIRHGTAKMLAYAVITFKDSSSALAAMGKMFGVGPSAGAVTGNATGFGSNSAYSYTPGEAMAVWNSGSKTAAVLGENVSESDFKSFAGSAKSQSG
jgi:hypothetical protein